MFAAGVGRPDVFAEPVIVHLVDLVDQDETWLGEIIGRSHNQVPQAACKDGFIDPAGNEAFFIGDVFAFNGEITQQDFGGILQIEIIGFALGFSDRKA